MIKILIIDLLPETRDNLHRLLTFEPDFAVIGSADSGAAGIQLANELKPQLVLVGETLADMDGITLIQQLRGQRHCILLSIRTDDTLQQQAAGAGAAGFLLKPVNADELYRLIRQIVQPVEAELDDEEAIIEEPRKVARPSSPISRPPSKPGVSSGEVPAVTELSGGESSSWNIPRMVDKPVSEQSEIPPQTQHQGMEPPAEAGELPYQGGEAAVDDHAGESPAPVLDKTARFSAFYPPHVQPEQRYGLYMYAHTAGALPDIQQDIQKFAQELGGSIHAPRTATRSAQLPFGTALTVVPECDAFEFEPASLTKKWRGNWTRFEFDFVPSKQAADVVLVRLSIQIEGIEIAHLTCPIDIGTGDTTAVPTRHPLIVPDNPLAAARLKTSTGSMYSKIFISYSRKDMEVVKAYRLAQLAAGHEVFMDTESIHAGENWQAALAKAIDEADIFQLFWSAHSAASVNVRDEWDYCLRYKCVDNTCDGFIRPVYWQKPLPAPPSELSHLNFRYVPLTADETD